MFIATFDSKYVKVNFNKKKLELLDSKHLATKFETQKSGKEAIQNLDLDKKLWPLSNFEFTAIN